MDGLVNIFCSLGFLEKFTNAYRREFPKSDSFEVSEDFEDLKNLSTLLLKHSVLKLDIDETEIIELKKTNPLINQLFKSERAADKIKFAKKQHSEIKPESAVFQNNCSDFFMLDIPENECIEIENNYGVMVFSAENFKKANFLFNHDIVPFDKKAGNLKNWNFAEKYRHPSNAMIIADNYLLSDSSRFIENLIPLLKNIMPLKLKKSTYNLTIIVAEDKRKPFVISKVYENIDRTLKTEFSYKINLTIVKYLYIPEIHDRNLITNYAWISSGFGFNMFKQKAIEKDTHLTFYPVTYIQNDFRKYNKELSSNESLTSIKTIHDFLIRQFKNPFAKKETGIVEIAGTSENRMLQ